MRTISTKNLLFFVLTALPFALSGVVFKRQNATPSAVITLIPAPLPPAATSVVAASPSVAVPSTPPTPNTPAPPPPPSPCSPPTCGWVTEEGPSYGKVVIRNHCDYTLNMWSVGARRMKSVRNATIGYAVPEDEVMNVIPPNGTYSEDYRITCPPAVNGTWGYCWDHDKLRGQAISLKISENTTAGSDILQFEYALVQNPLRGDTFIRLDYDVSMLDCGDPQWNKGLYGTNPNGTNRTEITDKNATASDHAIKLAKCPGYAGGLSVTFDPDPGRDVCPPIMCTGENLCSQIYNFDRSREGEPSMACHKHYRGNLVLDLCLKNKR